MCLQEYFLEDAYRGLFEAELGREYDFIVRGVRCDAIHVCVGG